MKKIFLSALLAAAAMSSHAQWNTSGNAATSANFLGTTNSIPLRIRTNNVQRMIIDSLGKVGIGIAAPTQLLTVQSSGSAPTGSWITSGAPVFAGYGEGAAGNADFNLLMASSTGANARGVFGMKRSRGTLAAPAAVLNSDQLGSLLVSGYDGSAFQGAAAVDFFADGAPTTGNVPMRISFVTGSNSGNRAERLRIGNTGDITINTNQLLVTKATGNVTIGAGGLQVAKSTNLRGLVGINGDTLSGNALYVRAGSALNGITVTDPGNNYVLYAQKTGINSGIYISKSSATSGSASIIGIGTSASIGVEGYSSINSGMYGQSDSAAGVYGYSASSMGVYGETGDAANYAGYFNGDVFSTGTFTSSDEKLKKNIRSLDGAMSIINSLQPRSYSFKTDDAIYAGLHLPQGNHYGLIAQDVERVLPGLVKRSAAYIKQHGTVAGIEQAFTKGKLVDFKGVNYTELIPVLVKGLQEQNEQLQSQADKMQQQDALLKQQGEKIDALIAALEKLTPVDKRAAAATVKVSSATLEQNVPNPPANNSTRIAYNLPESAANAELIISDNYGRTLKRIAISNKGKGFINLETTGLAAGNYAYAFVVDGKVVETKQMTILK